MTRHVWRAADAGVMLWEPAVAATTPLAQQEPHNSKELQAVTEADIQASLTSNYDDSEHDLVLPSIEGVFEPPGYIKSEPGEDISAVVSSTVGASASDISKQRCSSYDSQATLPVSTPCPSDEERDLPVVFRSPARASYQFDAVDTAPTPSVRRTLDFGMVTQRSRLPSSSELMEFTNEELRQCERRPNHSWDENEHTLLAILYRWYDDTDRSIIPRVFNAITDQDLDNNKLRNRYYTYIILFGREALPEFDEVLKVPFSDPDNWFREIHEGIRDTAAEIGVEMARREFEENHELGRARFAKSPKIRRYYKHLVGSARKRKEERSRAAQAPPVEDLPFRSLRLGGTQLIEQDVEESWSDIDDDGHATPVTPTPRSPRAPPGTQHIGFRVWDANSRTKFDVENGFVSEKFASETFSSWPEELLAPFSPDDEQGLRKTLLLAHSHLSLRGGASCYVSVSTSLLQALVKAANMQDPRIAVVALDHPVLLAPNKTLVAADPLRLLKSMGLASWARYKALAERMVYAWLPAAVILSHFPISDLRVLSDYEKACDDMLNLDDIRSGRTTLSVSALLRERNTIINIRTARAMALVCRTFKMHRSGVSLAHIQGLVSSLIDSFQLKQDESNTPYTSMSIAKAFAVSLRSRVHHSRDVEIAFADGVKQGTATIAFYSPRSRQAGRRRKTS